MQRSRFSAAGPLALAALLAGAALALDEPAPRPTPGPGPAPTVSSADLIGDKAEPGAEPSAPKAAGILDDLQPSGALNLTARQCYRLLGELKTGAEKISADLDNQGKEVDRLIRTSDALAGHLTDLAELWPQNEPFREACASAKRKTLVLNEELARVPRKWTHVRWAFTAAIQDIGALRLRARDLAEAEDRPVQKIGKDGKVYYVEAPPDDAKLTRSEITKLELNAEREKMRRKEEIKKDPAMPLDLDGTKLRQKK